MKQTLTKAFLISFVALGLIACDRGTIDSNLISQDAEGNNNIYRTYRLDYDEAKNQTNASATLSVGGSWGTTVKLVDPARLTINGVDARESTDEMDGGEVAAFYAGFLFPPAWLLAGASGTTYHHRMSGLAGAVAFEFQDNAGEVFYETAQIPQLSLSVPVSGTRGGFDVRIFGNPSDGRVSVRLSQSGASKSVSGRGSQVSVTASDLSEFSAGPVAVRVEVRFNDSIPKNGKSLGGSLRMAYSFAKRTLQLR